MIFAARLLLATLLFAATGWSAPPFPQTTSDLPADPAAHFGTLPNGLRYVIYPNREPKGRASLRLLVEAGSLNETEPQRGLAHYLEHLAFGGSTHFAPGTMVEFFQRMGMSFGGDTNANTGFDHTVYLLDLPDTKEPTLAEGLRVFADFAGGLLLQAPTIEKERGIILAEKRARDSVGFRTFVAEFGFLLDGTLLPKRIPIGETSVIEKAARPEFLDFYNTWYRPELMTVVVVGDVDVKVAERLVTAGLGDIRDRAPARPAPDRGRVVEAPGVRAYHHPEPEAPATTVSISLVTPYAYEPDTAANRLKYLPRFIATEIVNRRLTILAKQEGAPFSHGRLGVQEAFDLFREASIDLTCRADQWQAALSVAEQELRRALEFGFTASELEEVVANYRNDLQQGVKTAPTRHSSDLANEIVEAINQRDVFTSPATDLSLAEPALARITPADCLAALRQAWPGKGRNLMVTGNATLSGSGDATAAILDAYRRSRDVAVTPPAADSALPWAYADFGPAGKISRREHVDDLDLDLITFANGVRLNLKQTPFEAGTIRLSARVGRGTLTEPPQQRGLAALAGAVFDAGGLGRHSADDLHRILAGKNVGVQFRAGEDAFGFVSTTTPGDLSLDLQLMAAKITDPGYRPEALRQVRKGIDQLYLSFEHTANGPMATEVANLLANGDPRFGLPPKEILLGRTLDEVRNWLGPELTHGAIELAIVGDLDVEQTIDAVARTLGALPARRPKPAGDELRQVRFPPQPFVRSYRIDSDIPKGLVAVYWPTTDDADVRRTRRLHVLAEVLNDRLRVRLREQLGSTYSPEVDSFTSDAFPGYGYCTASVDVEPAMAERIAQLVLEQADDLARSGPVQDELERARSPMLTQIRESVRNNEYWLNAVLARAQERPQVLEWARSRERDVAAISVEDESSLAKTYLPSVRASRAIVVPAAAAGAKP